MNNKVLHFINKSVAILFGLILLLMSFISFDYIEEINDIFLFKIFKVFLFIGFCFLVYSLLERYSVSYKFSLYILLAVAFVLRLGFVLNVEIIPISDFKLLHDTAIKIANGETSTLTSQTYFKLWNYNIPFTLFQSVFIKISDSILLLQFVNIILSVSIIGLIYNCAKILFDEKSALISALMVVFFPPFIIYAGILTNQTISIFFLLLSLYTLLKNKNILWVGLFLGLAQIFRPIGTLFLFGTLGLFIYKLLSTYKFSIVEIKQFCINIFKLLVSYHFVLVLTSIVLVKGNFSQNSLYHNASSNYKFLVGLNYNTTGQYSEDDSALLMSSYDTTFDEYSKELIKIRLSDKIKVIDLFEEKFKIMWSSPDPSFYWANWYNENLQSFTNYFWTIILFFASIAILRSTNRLQNTKLILIPITLILFIGVYFLIEIQSRYRYELYPYFILLAGFGMREFFKLFKLKNLTNQDLN